MTYWIYDPRKLATSSTLIPYKQSSPGEVLNFFTMLCMLTYIYLYNTNQVKKYGNILTFVLITVFFLGIILGLPKDYKEINNDFSVYQNSLFID